MKIELLVDYPAYIEDVAEMVNKEFVANSGSKKSYKEVRTFFSNTYAKQFPITLIALEENECIGTVSVFENDLAERELYKPWLASLYTEPEHKGKGVGQKLINLTIRAVKDLGFKDLYLRTEDASEYYLARGWKLVESIFDESGRKIDIFSLNL